MRRGCCRWRMRARLVAARARLMQGLPGGGAMTAIAAGEAEVAAALAGVAGVSVAAVNGPSSVVISGDADAVARVAGSFAARGVRVRPLRVSRAFHSARMDPVLAGLAEVAAGLEYRAPRIAWAGALTGELVAEPGPGYWVRQAREPVRYADAVATLAGQGVTVFVEIGPDGTLSALGPAVAPEAEFIAVQRPDAPGSEALVGRWPGCTSTAWRWTGRRCCRRGAAGGPADLRVPAPALLASRDSPASRGQCRVSGRAAVLDGSRRQGPGRPGQGGRCG